MSASGLTVLVILSLIALVRQVVSYVCKWTKGARDLVAYRLALLLWL
jgi:hypothetical protein